MHKFILRMVFVIFKEYFISFEEEKTGQIKITILLIMAILFRLFAFVAPNDFRII